MAAAVICSVRPASAGLSRQSKSMLTLLSRHASNATERLRKLEIKDDHNKMFRDFKCNLTRHTSSRPHHHTSHFDTPPLVHIPSRESYMDAIGGSPS